MWVLMGRFSSPSGVGSGSFSYTLAFSRLAFGFVWILDSSLASFLGVVALPGLLSMPDLDTVSLVVPPPS